MKINHFAILRQFALIGLCVFYYTINAKAQAYLELESCKELKASFEDLNSQTVNTSGFYTYLLEKEIQPAIWIKVREVESSEKNYYFKNLPLATYRVTVISPLHSLQAQTKIYHRTVLENREGEQTANTFLSNVITLDEKNDCDEGEEHIILENTNSLAHSISIYPNPTENSVFVKWGLSNKVSEISLYNTTGELLQKDIPNANPWYMDLSDFPTGVYFLKMTNENSLIATKRISIIR